MGDVRVIRAALLGSENRCRYHGADLTRSGMHRGEPNCESCRQPYRVEQALAALDRLSLNAAT